MQGIFRLCAFLFYVSKSKLKEHIVIIFIGIKTFTVFR